MTTDDGRFPPGRATHEPSPAVSAVLVGIPSADDWIVVRRRSYGQYFSHEYAQVSTVKTKILYAKVGAGRRLQRVSLDDVLVAGSKASAQRLCERLDSAKGEAQARERAAIDAYKSTIARIYGQAMSAGTAETEGLRGDSPASAVGDNADAPGA